MAKLGRMAWTALGCACLAIGTAGAVIPVIPTIPFYMATAFCLAKGSKRLHERFLSSEFHRKHLKPFMESKAMPRRSKVVIIASITTLMGAGFLLMDGLVIPRVIVALVWLFHIWYFMFRIKTIPQAQNAEQLAP